MKLFSFYDSLKEKQKNLFNQTSYEFQLTNMLISMFEYESGDIPKEYLEFFLLSEGKCAIFELEGKLVVTSCEFIGNIDEYGIGKDLICTTLNGKQKTFSNWRINEKVVVIYNNDTYTPDMNVGKFSTSFAEIEKSLHHLVINSRYTNMIGARDEREKVVIENALSNNEVGKPNVILSIPSMFEENEGVKVLQLTDTTQSDKLQYLSKYHEDLRRRLSNIYGMSTSGTEKIAQQSSKEIENGESICFIIPLNMLKQRKKGIEEVNKKFNTDFSVDFSYAWKKEYEKWKSEPQEESQENVSRETLEKEESEENLDALYANK